jgi:hypothetical protein
MVFDTVSNVKLTFVEPENVLVSVVRVGDRLRV